MSITQAIFRKKVSFTDFAGPKLKQCLTATDLILLGVGGIIGTGIFVLTGHAAAEQAGPGIVLSFAVAFFPCLFAALAYAELAASVGGCGSAYGYSYAAFGELIAWIIGWDLILEYGIGTAAVANGWAGYFKTTLTAVSTSDWGVAHNIHLTLPDMLTKAPSEGGIVNLPAALIILVLTGLLIMGVKESARFNNVIVFIKALTIGTFIAVAAAHVNMANLHPFMPFGWFSHTADGKTVGVLAAASVIFFAYIGFDTLSIAVEETINPQRNIPIGIIGCLFICTIIYIVVSGLMTAVAPYATLNVSSPAAHALLNVGLNWAPALIATGVIAGLITVLLMLYYGLTRVIYAMARDGLLPGFFAKVSEKTHTPVATTLICGVLMAITAGCIPLGTLAELVNIGTLAAFVLVCGGVIALRLKNPDMPRPFKAPGGLACPILGILTCGALISFLPYLTFARFGIWLVVGMAVYFGYSMRHSRMAASAG